MTLACFLATSSRADASFLAYICDDALCTGGNDTIVTDQGAGDYFPGSAMVGQINSGALTLGGFTITTNVAQSKPLIGSAAASEMDLTFSAVTSDFVSHTIFLYARNTGFTGAGAGRLTMGGTQSPTGDGNSVIGHAWGGNSNNILDFSNVLLEAVGECTTLAGYGAPGRDRMMAAAGAR